VTSIFVDDNTCDKGVRQVTLWSFLADVILVVAMGTTRVYTLVVDTRLIGSVTGRTISLSYPSQSCTYYIVL
jgi:hypothetical protein